MTATLNLNLSDALNADDLQELTAICLREGKTLEEVLFEAAKARISAPAPKQEAAA